MKKVVLSLKGITEIRLSARQMRPNFLWSCVLAPSSSGSPSAPSYTSYAVSSLCALTKQPKKCVCTAQIAALSSNREDAGLCLSFPHQETLNWASFLFPAASFHRTCKNVKSYRPCIPYEVGCSSWLYLLYFGVEGKQMVQLHRGCSLTQPG